MAAPSEDMLRSDASTEKLNLPGDFSDVSDAAPDTGSSEMRNFAAAISAYDFSAEEYAVKNEVVREKGDKLSRNVRGTICLIITIAVFL